MESKLIFLVICVICCAVSCIKADENISTPTNLTSRIIRIECGKTKLCLDNPKGCDPSGSSQCYFTSVALSNISLTVELSGNSSGYIALAIGKTSDVSQDHNLIFVCGNNGSFFLQTSMLFDNKLWIINTPNVNNIQGSIETNLIQCVFSIPINENVIFFQNGTNVTISNITNSQKFIFLDILNGSTNGTELGAPTSVLESSVLINISDLNSTNLASAKASTLASTTPSTIVGTSDGTTPSTTVSTTAGTVASTKASTTASTAASPTADTADGTTAGTATSTKAGITACPIACPVDGSADGNAASTTDGTTANTTANTTAITTAKSNASISLTSLLSHAAICFLSIFLHLI